MVSRERVDDLRADILYSVALAAGWLKPAEKIFAVESAGLWDELRQRDRTDLLMSAGAYAEAVPDFAALSHWRKVGDAYFAMGEHDEARQYYRRGENIRGEDYMAFRNGPDQDRLMALAILREDWADVLQLIRDAEPNPFGSTDVVFAGSSRAKGPLIKICAHAAVAAGDDAMPREMRRFFGLSAAEVAVFLEHAGSGAYAKDARKFANPPMLRIAPRSMKEIRREGGTDRARAAADLLRTLEAGFRGACSNLEHWLQRGEEAALEAAVYWITQSGSFDLAKSCLAAVSNQTGLYHVGGERLILFYSAHPWITRASMRELLAALVATRAVPAPAVLLSCALQNSASIMSDIEKGIFDPDRVDPLTPVRAHAGWAESILGACIADGKVGPLWSDLCREAAEQPYSDIRRGKPFSALCDLLTAELLTAWQRDMESVRWKGEEAAYLALRALLPNARIMRHAMPSWLAPQHLDIFLPDAGVAIEYQGEQHYRPIAIFGGDAGFAATVRRDRNKARLCELAGVRLEFIRFDEDVPQRLREISSRIVL